MDLLDSWFKFNVGEGAFYAVFGFVFVFLGIALLILFFMLLGMIMKRVNARAEKKRAPRQPAATSAEAPARDEELSPEVLAVITAAIAAYYEGEQVKCDFVVRRIKRI